MKNNINRTFNLTVRFTFQIFLISLFYTSLTAVLAFILHKIGVISFVRQSPVVILLIFLMPSAVIGLIFAIIVSNRSFTSLNKILHAVSKIGKGDFDVQIDDIKKPEFLSEITQNINAMARELKNLEIMRKDFIQNFSHEFKTPIVSIQGFAKRLLTKDLDDEQKKEYLTIIFEESARLSRLAENTLIMSKLESLERFISPAAFSLDEQIRQCILLFEKKWLVKNINILIEMPENLIYIGDEQILKQVWINLLSNAIKFSNQNGEIRISASKEQNGIIVCITDNGIGMDELTQARMFDKYYQSDQSRTTEGNGLGLAIVRKIITLSNGEIKIKSQSKKGTTITIILPKT